MNPVRPTTAKSKKIKSSRSRAQHNQQGGQSASNNVNSSNNDSNQNSNTASEKESYSQLKEYAGIGHDSIKIYAEQSTGEELTEQAYNSLTEDINYKLRHIIHDCLVQCKLQGRETITSDDIEETFSNLNIDKVYGAPSSPNWAPFRDKLDTLYYLDDQKINLIEIAEKDFSCSQAGDTILDHVWIPDSTGGDDDMREINETLTEYFETMCNAVIGDDEVVRRIALVDISTNPSIGPITDWFYHFSYFLLMKDVTYDYFTMRVLHLLEVLENSPLPSLHIYSKQLKLLVRLLLQRLLSSATREEALKQMCYVLSLFCLRTPLRMMVLNKLEDKLAIICEEDKVVPLLNIVYFIGIDAIDRIIMPSILYFLIRVYLEYDPYMLEMMLAIYGLLCKAGRNTAFTYDGFREVFNLMVIPYCRPKSINADRLKESMDMVDVRKRLIKTRRTLAWQNTKQGKKIADTFTVITNQCCTDRTNNLEDILMDESDAGYKFLKRDIFSENVKVDPPLKFKVRFPCCSFREKIEQHNLFRSASRSTGHTRVVVGKTSLLLPTMKRDKLIKCNDHSLMNWHI